MDAVVAAFQTMFSPEVYFVEQGMIVFQRCTLRVPFPTDKGIYQPGTFVEQIVIQMKIGFDSYDGITIAELSPETDVPQRIAQMQGVRRPRSPTGSPPRSYTRN